MKNKKQRQERPKRWIGCPIETDYFGEDRKHGKMERKIATAKDRSKYKKTDRDKKQAQEAPKGDSLKRGRVLSITSQGMIVEHEGERFVCFLKGKLKEERSQYKNLVTVGDFVLFEQNEDNEGIISYIEPRKSFLSRADNLSQKKEQLIAANIDQVLITVSVVSPQLKPFLADRYVIAALKGNMTPIIIVNKIDLLQNEELGEDLRLTEQELFQDFIEAYKDTEIQVIPVSIINNEGIESLKEAMKDKVSVFSGQSGVGKTSLINVIAGLDLKIGTVVDRTQKGSHTTTTASLLPLPFGGWVIDTPGIKSFGIWNIKKDEILPYYSEIFERGRMCKYPDCSHFNEPGCAVIAAVENGEISALRFQSYLSLIESIEKEHLRR